MRKVFQLTDGAKIPQGGHSFEAPCEGSLKALIDAFVVPKGWTMKEVKNESLIKAAPIVEEKL